MVSVGSVAELEKLSGVTGITDLHRESIDHITVPSSQGKGTLKRVEEVFDCWFESGRLVEVIAALSCFPLLTWSNQVCHMLKFIIPSRTSSCLNRPTLPISCARASIKLEAGSTHCLCFLPIFSERRHGRI